MAVSATAAAARRLVPVWWSARVVERWRSVAARWRVVAARCFLAASQCFPAAPQWLKVALRGVPRKRSTHESHVFSLRTTGHQRHADSGGSDLTEATWPLRF